ncbi:MAG: hypothetical protein IJN79_00960 [Clostridia bacterium]|nr:hypothetical protein [Clostridia bacterium]MBQ2949123.1 hypothetical protein [Clostridia bacterium]MBQ4610033.1 hypothetical protein [Clostridia bacterium]MBQ6858427.1 hypothetical protein [Clostridia bacterium]MBQ7051356.1 hypothetical protein [Clostridia bacterium]
MAIKTNTTRTIERASGALMEKCEETTRNMEQLLARAGCSGAKKVTVTLPLIPGSGDDVLFIGLNGAKFYFLRGRKIEMAEPLVEILRNTGNL